MPLYEYKCGACGEVFEVIQKFSDQPLTVHEGCGGAVQRLLSAPALQFKGSGWYVTDYARKGNGKEGKEGKDGKPAAEAGKSDSSKSESKKSEPTKSEGSKPESKPASTTTSSEKK